MFACPCCVSTHLFPSLRRRNSLEFRSGAEVSGRGPSCVKMVIAAVKPNNES